MPFREDILDTYPKAIRELNRRGVDVGYLIIDNEYLLTNKEGRRKIIREEDLEKIERDLTTTGNLEIVEIELINNLL